MGGPGSGPRKGQRRSKIIASGGDEAPREPKRFPREIIDAIGVFDDPEAEQTYPRTGNRKYTRVIVEQILDAMENGASVRAICDAIGINERTYYRWLTNHEDFNMLVTMAEGRTGVLVDQKLIELGLDWNNPVALVMWANAHGKRWGYGKSERVDVNVNIGGGVDVNHILRDPRLIQLENELEARRQQLEESIIDGDFKALPPHDDDGDGQGGWRS